MCLELHGELYYVKRFSVSEPPAYPLRELRSLVLVLAVDLVVRLSARGRHWGGCFR